MNVAWMLDVVLTSVTVEQNTQKDQRTLEYQWISQTFHLHHLHGTAEQTNSTLQVFHLDQDPTINRGQ